MKGLCLAFILLLVSAIDLHAQTPYYQGKTIRIVTGYPAGDVNDLWPRLIAQYMTKYIPGNPSFIIQNMPGASSLIAANYVYGVAKPDGLNLGWIAPTLYFDQLVGRKKSSSIGPSIASWARLHKASTNFTCAPTVPIRLSKTFAKRPSRPNAAPAGDRHGFLLSSCLKRRSAPSSTSSSATKAAGYRSRGGKRRDPLPRHDYRIFLRARPFHTWRKNNFVKSIAQSPRKRDARLPDTPTIYELMDQYKTPEQARLPP